MNRLVKLTISLALPLLTGFVGSLATTPAIPTWYASLTKPGFNPPNWIFAPVWTTLYLLMGLALYRIWTSRLSFYAEPRLATYKTRTLVFFYFHLVLNAFWSIAFFGLNNPLLGLVTIIILLIFIIIIIKQFYRLDKIAAYLLLPYLAWVTFATILNFAIWYLN